ncbi:MAG: TMEM175 family protein [Acidobacteriota bacterium]
MPINLKKAMVYLSTQRIEAFSDGVFAIAITLLVLEIKVPHLDGVESLWTALGHLWSSYFGYVFSFVMIGVYWANHHHIFHLYKKTDHYFVLLNVFFLMCISFLPFPTAVLAEYIADESHRQAAVTFYAFGLFLPSLGWLLMWLYATNGLRLVDHRLTRDFIQKTTRTYALSNVFYLAAILISLWNGIAGLIVCVGLTLIYLQAPAEPVYLDENIDDN